MLQPLEKPDSHAKLISPLVDAGIADEEHLARVLDEAVPLQGASHADVIEYSVEIPLRYAECLALLSDGRKVGLCNQRQFVGWSRHDADRSLLFRSNGQFYEVAIEADLRGKAPGCIRAVYLEAMSEQSPSRARKFIGTDGHIVQLPVLPATI